MLSDQTVVLAAAASAKRYPDALRRVRYHDPGTDRRLVFLTNNFDLPALTIALLYKSRWKVELFFKWIKQHLRIQTFFGTSANAVKTQIWIAVSIYVLVAILKKRWHSRLPNYAPRLDARACRSATGRVWLRPLLWAARQSPPIVAGSG